VLIIACEIDAERIPFLFVSVFQMSTKPPLKIAGKSNVVELVPAIKRINSTLPANVCTNNVLVIFECANVYMLEMLAN